MKEETENQEIKTAEKTKQKSSEFYMIPWEDGEPFTLDKRRLETLISNEKREKYEKTFFYIHHFSSDLCKDELTLKVYCENTILIHFLIEIEGLYIQSNCKCKSALCRHSWNTLRYCLKAYGAAFFKRFYFPAIKNLAEDYKKLLSVETSFDGLTFIANEKDGRVLGFENEDERLYSPIHTTVKSRFLPTAGQQIIFGIPDDLSNFHRPILIPYLATPNPRMWSKRPFLKYEKSFLLNTGENRPKNLTKNQRIMIAVCEEMLMIERAPLSKLAVYFEDGGSDKSIDEKTFTGIYRSELLFDLWYEIIPFLKEEYIVAFQSVVKSPSLVRPTSLPSFRMRLSLRHPTVSFLLSYDEGLVRLKMRIRIGEEELDAPMIFPNCSGLFIATGEEGSYTLVDKARDAELVDRFHKLNYCLTVLPTEYQRFRNEILEDIALHYSIAIENRGVNRPFFSISNGLKCIKKKVSFSIKEEMLFIAFQLIYDSDIIIDAFTEGSNFFRWQGDYEKVILRDKASEAEERQFFITCHEDFERQIPFGVFKLPIQEVKYGSWLAEIVQKFMDRAYEVQGLEGLVGFDFNPYPMKWDMRIFKKAVWVEIELNVYFGNQRIDMEDLRRYVSAKTGYVRLPDDSYGRMPLDFKKRIASLIAIATETNEGLLRVDLKHFVAIQPFANKITDKQLQEQLKLQRKKLQALDAIQPIPKPERVQALLRPYQETGFSWMAFLREFGWGGILADDMGLGKTLQVLTLLEYHYEQDPAAPPSLIVLPNSLLFNWQQEVNKFVPHRRVQVHHGSNRSMSEIKVTNGELLLTTYGTLLADVELFRTVQFNYLILDESQAIKNPQSKRFECVQLIRSTYRLAMTGTPIENGIADLFAQLDFVNPGFLGAYSQFKRNFPGIADGTASMETKSSLQQLIAPFMLRRTKVQVAKDLPDKTEMVLYCDMLPEQRKIYDEYRKQFRSELEGKMEERNDQATMFVLEALMKLRQICCSPALVPDKNYPNQSAKLKEICEHISQKTQGHKLLVFSSFTKVLALLEEELKSMGVDYAYLDGKTKGEDRQAAVKRFQEEENCRVFLISLRAGGTGLNLTAADYVYIFDPWWNPAAETQAIDRCYRIGQNKHVMAYRMVCKDSIEEYILNMQADKKALAETLVQTDNSVLKSLNKEQLLKLFE